MIIKSINANSIINKYKSNLKTYDRKLSHSGNGISKQLSSEVNFVPHNTMPKTASYQKKVSHHIAIHRSKIIEHKYSEHKKRSL